MNSPTTTSPTFITYPPFLVSARRHRNAPFSSPQRSHHQIKPRFHIVACAPSENDAAFRAAKQAYKVAKAEYKLRKALYKPLKAQQKIAAQQTIFELQNSQLEQQAISTVAVCEGKSCCRMGADAVASLIGKQTERTQCMKMCGGCGPSVRIGDRVIKVDLKKAIGDAIDNVAELGTLEQRSASPNDKPFDDTTNRVKQLVTSV